MDAGKTLTKVEMRAIVIRADGSQEDLGTIAYWHRNPLVRWAHQIKKTLEKYHGNESR